MAFTEANLVAAIIGGLASIQDLLSRLAVSDGVPSQRSWAMV
jgi:hypothetical protein